MKLTKRGATIGLSLATGALLVALTGCDQNDGPAEQAGEKIDNAAEQAGEQMEKAGEAIKDAAKSE
ncbi:MULTISPECIES: hypothetical protein [Sedimenticola]|uniref:YtxH domain-containing protein n=1 Tax=Sedimenticola selenatireducens TaxID=191960 RepID=A0A2N6D1C4_9GAMM|nr:MULTISPECIES: hypothetical protein [Sedimenticola]MCW8902623.1 hypothetical protein [Sedimenticola sp.]PLX63488.1 MAG: hypothetical protein C0630_00870 [Sedimenticola selenatireducens]